MGPPIDIVTDFLCCTNYTVLFLYFIEVGLTSGGVGLIRRAHGAPGPVYAPDESSAGIQAWGEDLGLDPEGSVDFYTPELTVTPNDYILTRETAFQVVLAFLEMEEWPTCYEELPDCVEWEEL